MTGSSSLGGSVVEWFASQIAESIPLCFLVIGLVQVSTNWVVQIKASSSKAMEVARTVLEVNTGLSSAFTAACESVCIMI